MIGENPSAGDVGNFGGAEQVLVRYDIGSALDAPGEVAVGVEVAVFQSDAAFDAVIFPFFVIEGGQHIGRAKLPVIEQIARELVIAVNADLDTGNELLFEANVKHMAMFGENRTGE